MKKQIKFTYRYLIIILLTPTYDIALLLFASVLFLVTIATYIYFKLNFVLTLNFIWNIIIISICNINMMSLYWFFACILLQKVLGMSWTSVILTTSRHGWIMVRVGTVILCFSYFCFQLQLVFYCMEKYIVPWKLIHQKKSFVRQFLYYFVAYMPMRWIEWRKIYFCCVRFVNDTILTWLN